MTRLDAILQAEALADHLRRGGSSARRGDIPPAVRLGRNKIWQTDRVLDHFDRLKGGLNDE